MSIWLFRNLVRFFLYGPNPTLALAVTCAAQHWAYCPSACASPFASLLAGSSTEPPGSHGRCRMLSGQEKSGMSPLPPPVPVPLCVCVCVCAFHASVFLLSSGWLPASVCPSALTRAYTNGPAAKHTHGTHTDRQTDTRTTAVLRE